MGIRKYNSNRIEKGHVLFCTQVKHSSVMKIAALIQG